MKISTRKLVYLSLSISLSIILTRIFSIRLTIAGVEGVRIGIGGLPIIFAGIFFGPLAGGIVGAVSDVIGYLINPMGAYMPHFTLTSLLTGLIPGLVSFYLFKARINYLTLLVSIGIGQIITSVVLVPIFMEMLFGIPFEVTVIPKIIGQLIHIPLYAFLMKTLMNYGPIKDFSNKYN